ncbi:MAG: V-type ATP synthase subunit I [Candidatus Heimdallarchaeota archaeon]
MVELPRPVKMQVMKVTAHKKHERVLLNTLLDTNAVEFIDVELKESYSQMKSTDQEQEVSSLVRKAATVIEFLEISAPTTLPPEEQVQLDDGTLAPVLDYCQKVLMEVEPANAIRDELQELESQLEDLKNTLRLAELLAVMPEMFFEDVGEGAYFYITAGLVNFKDTQRLMWQLKEATDEKYLFFEKYAGEGDSVVAVAVPNEMRRMAEQILSSFGFRTVSIPPNIKGRAPQIIEQTNQQIELANGKVQGLIAEKEQLAQKYQNQLLAAYEALEIEEEKIATKRYFRETETSMALWAWISESNIDRVTKIIQKSTNDEAMVQVADPQLPEEAYPTQLENGALVKPLAELTKSFGAPGYHELDPSWIMALAFPIMFGVMFADIGHGLLLLLMGLAGIIANKRSGIPVVQEGMMDELKTYFKKGGWLLFFCGLSSIVFGFVFGSFFGIEDFTLELGGWTWHFKPLWFNSAWEANSDHMLHAPGGPYIGISGTILMLELSIMIGITHITSGLILKAYQTIKDGKTVEAICFPVMLIIFYFSGFILVFTYDLNPLNWMQMTDSTPLTFGLLPHFTPTIPPALLVFLGGFLAPVMVMIVYMMKGHGIEGMSEVFDYALSLVSHTLSYARILAINKVHAVLSALFLFTLPTIFAISSIHHPHTALGVAAGVGIVNIVFQCLIIMTLEALISFLQTLRLNWVEFFSKFFEGRGHLFKPFSYARRFTKS